MSIFFKKCLIKIIILQVVDSPIHDQKHSFIQDVENKRLSETHCFSGPSEIVSGGFWVTRKLVVEMLLHGKSSGDGGLKVGRRENPLTV